MLRVRSFEERVRELFAGGRIPGFLHTSVGQEAVAVGAAAALRPDDYVLSTHRGHGHLVAKGGSLRGLMAELYGKANGICQEGPMRGSTGAWLAWVVMEECFDDLDAPIARVAGPNIPIPFSPPLEAFATPKAEDVVAVVRQVLK